MMSFKTIINQYFSAILTLGQVHEISWRITVIYSACIILYYYHTKNDEVKIVSSAVFSTPKKRFTLLVLYSLFIIISPYLEAVFYSVELNRDKFSPNADSISLPLFWYSEGLLFASPFIIIFMYFSLKEYPGKVYLFKWNKQRPFWSLFWSIIFYCFIFYYIYFSIHSLVVIHFEDFIGSIFAIYLLLCLRASLVMSTLFQNKKIN